MNTGRCLRCHTPLTPKKAPGGVPKKFCDNACRCAYHYPPKNESLPPRRCLYAPCSKTFKPQRAAHVYHASSCYFRDREGCLPPICPECAWCEGPILHPLTRRRRGHLERVDSPTCSAQCQKLLHHFLRKLINRRYAMKLALARAGVDQRTAQLEGIYLLVCGILRLPLPEVRNVLREARTVRKWSPQDREWYYRGASYRRVDPH